MANNRTNAANVLRAADISYLTIPSSRVAGTVRSQMTKLLVGGQGFDSNSSSADRHPVSSVKGDPCWGEGIKRPESDADHQPPSWRGVQASLNTETTLPLLVLLPLSFAFLSFVLRCGFISSLSYVLFILFFNYLRLRCLLSSLFRCSFPSTLLFYESPLVRFVQLLLYSLLIQFTLPNLTF